MAKVNLNNNPSASAMLTFWVLFILSFIINGAFCYTHFEEKRPIYLTSSVGHYVILNCEIDFPESSPIPFKLYWKKDGKPIFTYHNGVQTAVEPYVGRIQLLNDPKQAYDLAAFNFTSIRESDAGWLECQIVFPNRTPAIRNNGTWIHLTVNDGNLVSIPPINRTILEGEEAEFVCLPKDPDETTIIWYKDGINLKDYPDLVHRTWVNEEGTLFVRPAEMVDSGEYECEALHTKGEQQTAKAYLNVEYKAKVVYAPPEIHLPFGRAAMIDCHYRANPPITNLRWEKDGFLFDPYNIQGVFYRKNGSLHFRKVDDSHNGVYTCTPYNKLGSQGPSPPMTVIVERTPNFVVTPHNLYIKKIGEPLDIPCDARDGENGHKPIVVWYKKDGSSLPTGRYAIKEGNLTIFNVQEEDRGLYICSASNKAATITAETELLVETVPSSAPYNLTAVPSQKSIYLRWQTARHRNDVNYSIWYKPVEATEWKTYVVPPTSYLEATVYNLQPGREYEFMVLCKDQLGDGLFSKAIRAWTSIDADLEFSPNHLHPPVGYPRNISVHPTYNGFLVTWVPPEYGLEYLKHYIVRWTQDPDDYLYGNSETRNSSFLIKNLSEGHIYHIQVISVAEDGQQAVSEKVSITISGYRKIQAVSTGIIAGFAFLIVVFVGGFYVKKKFFANKGNANEPNVVAEEKKSPL